MKKRSFLVLITVLLTVFLLTSCAFLYTDLTDGGGTFYTVEERENSRAFLDAKIEAEKVENVIKAIALSTTNSGTIDNSGWATSHTKEARALKNEIISLSLPSGSTILSFTTLNGNYSYSNGVGTIDLKCSYKYQRANSKEIEDGTFSISGVIRRTSNSFCADSISINGRSYSSIYYTYSERGFIQASINSNMCNTTLLNEIAHS